MDRVLVVRPFRAETSHSPEFSYLASWISAELRAVFPRAISLQSPWLRDTLLDRAYRGVLVLADDRILVGRRTLAAMRDAVNGGADVACPQPLAAFARRPLYTLRDFELLEAEVLTSAALDSARTPGSPGPVSHLPVSLWSFSAIQRAFPDLSIDRLLGPEPSPLALGLRVEAAGAYHGFIDYYAEPRHDVLGFVPAGTREVLEIGCGRGTTGKLLRDRLGCRVTGVEMNPAVAREAEGNLDRVIVGDIQTLSVDGRYDLVLALELFEHLTQQEDFLARMKKLLRPGGLILLSVPNVGHYSVVRDLLAGRWDYLPIGLLCFTHYRFFTRATLENWFARCGFARVELVAQTTELPAEFTALSEYGLACDLESLRTKGFFALLRA